MLAIFYCLTVRQFRPVQAICELLTLSLIHISEPTRLRRISYAVFCLKKKKEQKEKNQNTNTPTTSTLPSFIFFLMIRRPPRSTPKPSSAASDVYKRQSSIFPGSQSQLGKLLTKYGEQFLIVLIS